MKYSLAANRPPIVALVLLALWPLPVNADESIVNELIGQSQIGRVLAMGPVTALSTAEAQRYVGIVLRYGPKTISVGRKAFAVKSYERRQLTRDEFLTENKLAVGRIGTTRKSIVEISAQGDPKSIADQLGADVYVLDGQTIVIAYRGVFLQGRRQGNLPPLGGMATVNQRP